MDELETLLNKYRPSDPPSGLREQIVDAARETRVERGPVTQLRQWIAPVALAAAALMFYVLAGHERERIAAQTIDIVDKARSGMVDELTASLGGGDTARLEAERAIAASERAAMADGLEMETVIR